MRPLHFFIALSAALIINSVGLGLIYLRFNSLNQALTIKPDTNNSTSSMSNQEVVDKLTEIQNQLFSMQTQSGSNSVLGSSSSESNLSEILPDLYPSPSTITNSINNISQSNITISSASYSPVSVYQSSSDSSSIIATISYGQKYPFSTKINSWYLITLPSGKLGWVKSQFVKETP